MAVRSMKAINTKYNAQL